MTVFAQRKFPIIGGDIATISLLLHKPTRRRSGEYACRYSVIADKIEIRKSIVYGADSLQALLGTIGLAMFHVMEAVNGSKGIIDPIYLADLRRMYPKAFLAPNRNVRARKK